MQNFEKETIFFRRFYFRFARFTPYFHFRCVARATFDRNLNHSANACFLVMACVAYSRVRLKTLSSLLKFSLNFHKDAGTLRRVLKTFPRFLEEAFHLHNVLNTVSSVSTCEG